MADDGASDPAASAPKLQYKGGYRQINKALNIDAFEDYLEAQISRLPELADVEQISPRVLRVLGQNAGQFTLQGTNTYIVGTGARRLIIDTGQGIPEWANLIADTLLATHAALSHVLLTHWHGDHTGGVPDLLRLYPHLVDSIYKHTPGPAMQPIVDGQVFRVEGATVRAVHAPGHSHDHMCFILEEENAMVCPHCSFSSSSVFVLITPATLLPSLADRIIFTPVHRRQRPRARQCRCRGARALDAIAADYAVTRLPHWLPGTWRPDLQSAGQDHHRAGVKDAARVPGSCRAGPVDTERAREW
jgi:glyoxylase-like metal-dependent hydrolase (beta-lactamase superfamily II)